MTNSRSMKLTWIALAATMVLVVVWFTRREAGEPAIAFAPKFDATAQPTSTKLQPEPAVELAERANVAPPIDSRARSIRVHVLALPSRAPIEHAQVSVKRNVPDGTAPGHSAEDAAIETTTDREGLAELGLPKARDLVFTIAADGFFPIAELKREFDASSELTFELEPAGRLHVRVLEADRKPIAKAFVEVWPGDPSSPNGRARFPRIWPQFYSPRIDWHGRKFDALHQLSATDEKGELWIESLPCDVPLIVSASEAVAPIKIDTTIPSDVRTREIELVAFAHGCLRGRIVWDDGSPAKRVAVTPFVDNANGAFRQPEFTDKDGRFEICGLQHARVVWRIDVAGELSRSTLIDAPIVDVGEIRLPRLEELELQVHASHVPKYFGYNVIYARIYQHGELIETSRKARDREPGGFDELGHLKTRVPAGPTHIELQGIDRVQIVRDVIVPTDPVEFDLDGAFAELHIDKAPIDKAHSFAVVLCPEPATPDALGGKSQVFYSWDASQRVGWRDDDLVLLMCDPGNYEVFSAVDDGPKLDLGHIALVAGQTTTLVPGDVRLATVHGRLIDANSNPIAGGTVLAIHPALEHLRERKRRTMTSAKDGTFEMKDALPGRWTIFPDSLGPGSAEAKTIDVKPGDEIALDLVVGGLAKLSGHVRVSGRPFANASICVDPCSYVDDASRRVTRTDASGAYSIEKLYPGRYQVDATASDDSKNFWAVQVRNVELHAGESLEVDFDADVGSLRMRVEMEGQPLTDPTEWSGAIASTSSGMSWLHPIIGEPGVFTVTLEPGPCLVMLVAPKSFPSREPGTQPSFYSFAFLESIEPDKREVVANVHGGELVVRSSAEGAPLPFARLLRVKSIENRYASLGVDGVVFVDDQPGVRRFPSIPLGATLELSSSYPSSPRDSIEVHVDSTEPVIIDWPPKR